MNSEKVCDDCTFNKLLTNYNSEKRFEKVYINPATSEKKYFEFSCTPVLNFNSQPTLVDIIRDITDRKNAENGLRNSEKKYREAYTRANFYKDLFIHDINNILQYFQLSVDLLSIYQKSGKLNEIANEWINITKEQVDRGSNLVSNVRRLSEIEEIGMVIFPIEVGEVLKQAIQYVIQRFHNRTIIIQINPPDKKFYIKANEFLLIIFENILVNSINYNRNPMVEIIINLTKLKRDNIKYLKIEFIDNGIGIPDLMKEKVFLGTDKLDKRIGGMGLGLSLVKKIIEKYNGQIWIEDRIKGDYSNGSKFIILTEICSNTKDKAPRNIISLINV